MAFPVWDTHTHLDGARLSAQSFWDIGHYFWFLRELRAAGYPSDADQLPERERMTAFVKAFVATRNTRMNWVVRRICVDLYGVELSDVSSVRLMAEAVRETSARDVWPQEVCERIGLRRIVVNSATDADFAQLPGVSCCVPRLERPLSQWIERIKSSASPASEAEEVRSEVHSRLSEFAAAGHPGVMTSEGPFAAVRTRIGREPPQLVDPGVDAESAAQFVLHCLCAAAQDAGLTVQLFLGVNSVCGTAVPVNDPERVVRLHGLFHAYACRFELVLASELNNLDVVQAARVFPNVSVGGMWWYNFRASTYRDSMLKRIEALPACKSAIVVSDARCIEWAYGKILLIKRLLADLLTEQVDHGWLSADDAFRVAQGWLHDTADRLYGQDCDCGATPQSSNRA